MLKIEHPIEFFNRFQLETFLANFKALKANLKFMSPLVLINAIIRREQVITSEKYVIKHFALADIVYDIVATFAKRHEKLKRVVLKSCRLAVG